MKVQPNFKANQKVTISFDREDRKVFNGDYIINKVRWFPDHSVYGYQMKSETCQLWIGENAMSPCVTFDNEPDFSPSKLSFYKLLKTASKQAKRSYYGSRPKVNHTDMVRLHKETFTFSK